MNNLNSIAAVDPGTGGAGGGDTTGITNPALGETLQNIFKGEGGIGFFQRLFPSLITLLLIIGSVAFFFMLLLGAIGWITSAGDKAAVESARGRITSAIAGLFIMFAIFAIVLVVEQFFGTNILTLDIGVLKIE